MNCREHLKRFILLSVSFSTVNNTINVGINIMSKLIKLVRLYNFSELLLFEFPGTYSSIDKLNSKQTEFCMQSFTFSFILTNLANLSLSLRLYVYFSGVYCLSQTPFNSHCLSIALPIISLSRVYRSQIISVLLSLSLLLYFSMDSCPPFLDVI